MKKFLKLCGAVGAYLALSLHGVQANSEGPALDHFPMQRANELASLQNGAKLFVNYCSGCHSASMVRYNRMQDFGLSEAQIKSNLLFTTDKVGNTITIAMAPRDAKSYFGAIPPDLSLTARARSSSQGSGADWIYTYLRSFYRDAARPTGWNNVIFENVGMPHVFWQLQGPRVLKVERVQPVGKAEDGESKWAKVLTSYDEFGIRTTQQEAIESGHPHESVKYNWVSQDPARAKAYDDEVADLVAFMSWMSDPTKALRLRLGVIVLFALMIFTLLAWGLNRSYWKDIR